MIDHNAQIKTFQSHINVSRETIERLGVYHDLLIKWNPAINLVGRTTIGQIWQRHFLDSAQLWDCCPKDSKSWIDLGSGAGFPGMVIAILAAEKEPGLNVELVESDARKSAFLLKTSQELSVSVKIHTRRIEDMKAKEFSVISARALAPLHTLFGYSERFLGKNTALLLQKGKNNELELTEAREYWTFNLQKTQSITDPDGVILKIEGLRRA